MDMDIEASVEIQSSTIMIVDDNPTNLGVIADYLEERDFETMTFRKPSMVLELARLAQPDLILLDVLMPDINGFELCRRLKADEQTKDIPVIFMTALTSLENKIKGFEVGGVDYITKPIQQAEVLARVTTHLQLRAQQKRLKAQAVALAQAKESAEKAQHEAEMANQAKSKFLSNMSHELRTPLNAILGFTTLMERSSTLSGEHQEYVGIIHRSGDHLLTLINHVLDLSKIEAGRTTLNEKNFDLYQLLKDLEEMFRLKARDKELELLFEWDETLPRYVRTDEVKLRQVLINLLNNALKFTDEGGVSVRVRANAEEQISFEVEDTGAGIASAELETLFEAFVQSETGRTAQEGTGLGLTISREFVRLMDGKIHVRSQLGVGSLFAFEIRLKVVSVNDLPMASQRRRVIGLERNQPVYRLLVVDDQVHNRLLLTRLLMPLGFELREASNGQEALQIWQRWQPDLVWMDMRMPIMDGYEATRRIKGMMSGKKIPIIALTASIYDEERHLVLEAGCDDFLRKPFREAELFEMMQQHLGVRYLYEEMDSATPKTAESGVLTPAGTEEWRARIAHLPLALRTKLEQAAITANMLEVDGLIRDVANHDARLGEVLAGLADEFEYGKIVRLVGKG